MPAGQKLASVAVNSVSGFSAERIGDLSGLLTVSMRPFVTRVFEVRACGVALVAVSEHTHNAANSVGRYFFMCFGYRSRFVRRCGDARELASV